MPFVTLDVSDAVKTLERYFGGTVLQQLPYATSLALNATGEKMQAAEKHEIKDVFDRPTPYTQDSVYLKRATKQDLQVAVGLKDFSGKGIPATKFLAAQIAGGGRHFKRFEIALRRIGVLPDDMYAVPASGAKIDSFGNMDRGQIVQILAWFKAFPEAGYKANLSDKRRTALQRGRGKAFGTAYFVGRPGDRLPLGVWQRIMFSTGSAIRPVLVFVNSVHYEALLDFAYVAQKTAEKEFEPAFAAALAKALATAR